MNNKNVEIIQSAIAFTAKFGFLTQDLFFEFLCPRGRAQKYVIWNQLQSEGYFVTSQRNPKILYFAKNGFASAGSKCVKRRYFYYVDHDSIVAKLFFNLKSTGNLLRSWTEPEFRAAPWEALRIVGSNDAEKLPDLVFDLKGADGFVRVALEVEASRKSSQRYDQIALSYLAMKKINLLVFVCENESLQNQIEKSFFGNLFVNAGKSPVTILLKDFEQSQLMARCRYMGHEMPFLELISKALKVELKTQTNGPDKIQTAVWKDKMQNSGGAA